MRGGFVACLGDPQGRIVQAVERLRWHSGPAASHRCDRVEIATLCDPRDGPRVESGPEGLLLVHGDGIDSLAALQSRCTRFAAVSWDGQVLRASRDPMGLAPLFYRITDRAAWLATEISALLDLGPNAPHLDALCSRAAFAPLDEETGWAGIRRVLPGCTLEIDGNLRARTVRYWNPEARFGTYRGTRADAVAELRERFRRAVERCFEPGAAVVLSGGQDSAAVAVSIPSNGGKPHLVHARFPDLPRTHEGQYAQAVAGSLGAALHAVSGELTPWNIDAELDLHTAPYSWMPYGIDEAVQGHLHEKGIRVALDGHDGDGILGPPGGVWRELFLKGRLGRLGGLCRSYGLGRAARGLVSDLVPYALLHPGSAPRRTYLENVAPYFSGEMQSRIRLEDARWTARSGGWRTRQLNPLSARATISYEHKELEAARHGFDLRHPFADREFVDFMISLPCATKADPVRTKSLLIEALGEDLPALLRDRPKSDYMDSVRRRVDPARCIDTVRSSGVRFDGVDYGRLFEQGDTDPQAIPLYLLVNLARVHRFAQRSQ